MANDGPLFPGISLRLPPQNLMAEAAILGALLHNNKTMDQCVGLRPEHFADPEYGRLFGEIIDRVGSGSRVDAVSLRGQFNEELLADAVSSMIGLDVRSYIDAVRDCANRRQLIEIGEGLVSQAFAGETHAEAAIEAAARIDALAVGSDATRTVTLNAALDNALQAMEDARHRQGPAGISTGFPVIDERIGGLEPGTLTVVAGRPGMGKSAIGWQVAVSAARDGIGVLAISLEMSARELGRRALATVAAVPIAAMKYGRVTTDQASRLVVARRAINDLPLTIEDGAGLTASMIAARARAVKRKGLGLVLVDHLHIVRPDDADVRQGATWAVGRISGAMKRLAKDCGVPVLLLAQLNRGVEGRDDKRPGLGDLRQAGDIEQDADAVGFVYRPEYYMANEPERRTGELDPAYVKRVESWAADRERVAGKAELIWAKIRDGEPGTDALWFDGPTTTFRQAET